MENILFGLILFFSLEREWRYRLLDLIDLVIEVLEPGDPGMWCNYDV